MSQIQEIDIVITLPEENLNVMIQSLNGRVSGYDLTMSQEGNSHASSSGREITSATRTGNDILAIDGWVRCFKCGSDVVDFTGYAARFKRAIERQKYTTVELATITTPIAKLNYMRCVSVRFSQDADLPDELLISSEWEASNISGSLSDPGSSIGGVEV